MKAHVWANQFESYGKCLFQLVVISVDIAVNERCGFGGIRSGQSALSVRPDFAALAVLVASTVVEFVGVTSCNPDFAVRQVGVITAEPRQDPDVLGRSTMLH